jgi:hypothetical protein
MGVMTSLAIAAVVLACVFGGALVGLALRALLPTGHLGDDTKDIVKLGISLLATLSALVLGLLVSSARDSFTNVSTQLTNVAVTVVELDRVLAQYGPETNATRDQLKDNFASAVEILFSGDPMQQAALARPEARHRSEGIAAAIRQLVPGDAVQSELRSQALGLVNEVVGVRWLLVVISNQGISIQLLAVVVAWLTIMFMGFGLFAPRNATLVAALFMVALCASGAVFLIVELNQPLDGWIRVPDGPMRAALAQLGG